MRPVLQSTVYCCKAVGGDAYISWTAASSRKSRCRYRMMKHSYIAHLGVGGLLVELLAAALVHFPAILPSCLGYAENRIIAYHIISYHIISYHIILYHIISTRITFAAGLRDPVCYRASGTSEYDMCWAMPSAAGHRVATYTSDVAGHRVPCETPSVAEHRVPWTTPCVGRHRVLQSIGRRRVGNMRAAPFASRTRLRRRHAVLPSIGLVARATGAS